MKKKIVAFGMLSLLMTMAISSFSTVPYPTKKFYTITEDTKVIAAWCANNNGICLD